MKKYKLLKDIKGVKAWTIFKYDKNIFNSELYKKNFSIYNLILIIWIDNKDFFKEIKSIFELNYWDDFYHLWLDWDILRDDNIDLYKIDLNLWNIFSTEHDAEKEKAKRIALINIKKWRYENNAEYEFVVWGENWNICLQYNKLHAYQSSKDKKHCIFYFSSLELTKRCLEECKKDWEILFN